MELLCEFAHQNLENRPDSNIHAFILLAEILVQWLQSRVYSFLRKSVTLICTDREPLAIVCCVFVFVSLCVYGRCVSIKTDSLHILKIMTRTLDIIYVSRCVFCPHTEGTVEQMNGGRKAKITGVCFSCCLISRHSLISLIIKLLSKQRQAGKNWPSPAAYTSGGRV